MSKAILGPDGSPVSFVEMQSDWIEDRSDNSLTNRQEQFIPGWFLDDLAEERQASTNTRAGEFHHVAAVPEAVVYDLKVKYGFDVMNAPIRDTLAMLRRYSLDHFIATNKRI